MLRSPGSLIDVSLSGDLKTVILELEAPTGGLLGKVDMDLTKELTALGVPTDLFMLHEEHGTVALKAKFIRWCGFANPSIFEEDHLRDGDTLKSVTVVTDFKGGSKQTRRGDVLTKRGIRRTLFKAKNPEAVEYTDQILDILDEVDRDGTYIPEELNDWQRARAYGKLERRAFTDVLRDLYEINGSSQPFSRWASNFTKMITKTALGISDREFNERKLAVGGNFRDAATAEELVLLSAAEARVSSLIVLGRLEDIKALYHQAKEDLEVFA